jgi:hypothetical protein
MISQLPRISFESLFLGLHPQTFTYISLAGTGSSGPYLLQRSVGASDFSQTQLPWIQSWFC